MEAVLEALDRATVKTASEPSATVTELMPGSSGSSTLVMVGALSLSVMVPRPLAEPMAKGTISVTSMSVSLTVGRVTVKPLTPGGTVNTPPERVTPLLKVAVV